MRGTNSAASHGAAWRSVVGRRAATKYWQFSPRAPIPDACPGLDSRSFPSKRARGTHARSLNSKWVAARTGAAGVRRRCSHPRRRGLTPGVTSAGYSAKLPSRPRALTRLRGTASALQPSAVASHRRQSLRLRRLQQRGVCGYSPAARERRSSPNARCQ